MLPDPIKIMAAPHVKRDPDTDEVSWPPDQILLELMDLGLIPRDGNHTPRETGLRNQAAPHR